MFFYTQCRLVQNLKDVCWNCPNCKSKFICNKKKNNFDKNKNCYLIKQNSLIKNDTSGLFKNKNIVNINKKEKKLKI